MKITPLNVYKNQNFLGHGAGKIKALYMQNPNLPAQIPVYSELRNIGKAHNFDVYIQGSDEILNNPAMKHSSTKYCEYELWSQDNKTIINKDGQVVVVSGLYMPETEKTAVQDFAKLKNVKQEIAELVLEGGNLFLGKKPDGKNYLIIGYKDIQFSALHFYLKRKLDEVTFDDMNEFIAKSKLQKDGRIIATYEEFDRDFHEWGSDVIENLQKAFDVEKQDITILSQGEYHNDLVIRPLNYPYVLINDEKMSMENLEKLKSRYKFNPKTYLFARQHKKKMQKQSKEYASCDELCRKLEKKGFIPIRIGGGYGLRTINFINAIVHQNGDDLIYITNSGISNNKNYIFLQKLFEQDLKKKCPQISHIYFVAGAPLTNGSNIVLEYLKRFKGGVHCLCAEEMCI